MTKNKIESPYRNYIVGLDKKIPLIDGSLVTYVNFDNAATTPPLVSVMEKIKEFVPWYSSIHRGKGYKSQLSSNLFEESRSIIANFVGADLKNKTVIYVKNTTEAINKLSYRLCDENEKNVILSSEMEHHSNDLPWRNKYELDYIRINDTGRLSLEDLETKLIKYKDKVKLVTITGASNVTGHVNQIHKIAGLVHKYNTQLMVDGAQLVPHAPVDMKDINSDEHIDYICFSAHKMYAPFGTGILIGPKTTFNKGTPEYVGGGTVDIVTHDFIRWDNPPHKEEAGSPNVIGVIALAEAIKTLTELGMKNILNYEEKLTQYILKKLKTIKDISIYSNCLEISKNNKNEFSQIGIVSFNLNDFPHNILALILANEAGIAVRNGCFCAQPYIQKLMNISDREIQRRIDNPELGHPGLVRVSFGMYNNYSEIDYLIETLHKIVENKEFYLSKYK